MILSGLVQVTRQMPQDMTNTEMGIVIAVCVLAGVLLGYGIYAIFHKCQPRKGGGGGGNGWDWPTPPPDPPKGGDGIDWDEEYTLIYVPPGWLEDKQDA